jgi:hypothetical protein
VAHVRFKLVQVLMGHCEADTVLAKFREHVRQGKRGEALELVDVDEEFSALGCRCVGPAKCGKPNGRDEQPAKKRRAIFADVPLGQVDQENLALIHDPADVQVLFRCGQYSIEQRVCEKRPAALCPPSYQCGYGLGPASRTIRLTASMTISGRSI